MPTASDFNGLCAGVAQRRPTYRVFRLAGPWPIALAIGLLAGCGDGSGGGSSPSATTGPHGGPLVALPGERGYAEILVESAAAGKGAAAGKERVVVFFLEKDAAAALKALPADVRVKLRFPDAEPADVPLAAEPKPGDPAGAGRFASKPGTYAVDRPIGELTAVFDGQPFTGAFAASR